MSDNIFDVDRNLWAALFMVKMRLKMNNDCTGEDVYLTDSYKHTQHFANTLESKVQYKKAFI